MLATSSKETTSKLLAKKQLSGSITSLIKGKEKQQVDKAVLDHFYKMAMVPQTGNSQGTVLSQTSSAPPPHVQEASMNQFCVVVEARVQFLKENNLMEEVLMGKFKRALTMNCDHLHSRLSWSVTWWNKNMYYFADKIAVVE
jgi:hypothetical protein